MANIGFNASIENEKEIEDFEKMELKGMLEHVFKDVRTFEEFKDKLKSEFNSVNDLENNLQHISIEIKSIQMLVEKREDIFRKLVSERNKNSNINQVLCRKYFDILNDIDKKVRNSLDLTSKELGKLIANENILFSITPDTKNAVTKIGDEAKALYTEMKLISSRYYGLERDISSIYQEITQLIQTNQPNRKIIEGFNKTI